MVGLTGVQCSVLRAPDKCLFCNGKAPFEGLFLCLLLQLQRDHLEPVIQIIQTFDDEMESFRKAKSDAAKAAWAKRKSALA